MKNTFLSVLEKSRADDLSFTLTFTAKNNPFTTGSMSVPVTNITQDDSPSVIASKIQTEIEAKLSANNDLLRYGGITPFTLEEMPFTFRTYVTEHIINIWSPCQYVITSDIDKDKLRLSMQEHPVFPLLSEVEDIASIKGVNLVDQHGRVFTPDQVQRAIESASAQLCAWLRGFNVILSTYLHSETGQWWRGFGLRYNPVVFHDSINIRGPYIPNYVGALGASVVQRFDVDSYTGVVEILDFSEAIQLREVGDFGNQSHLTYAAGYDYVPNVLKTETVRVLGLTKEPLSIAEIRGGRGGLKFKDKDDVLKEILYNLQEFAP